MDDEAGAVGRVLGTRDATPLGFWVGVVEGQWLQLDDVVTAERCLPNGQRIGVSGVVNQIVARYEGPRFDSDVFLVADGVLPAEIIEAAEILTTRVEPETYVPLLPGAEVRRATGDERDRALYFDKMETKVPAGLGRDGEPLYINLEFIDGTRGAHVNISGISGVATKTTYATFLLYGLFHAGVLGREAANTKALVFNVKGEDLLFLDHPNVSLSPDDEAKYRKLGLVPGPFDSVAVYAPPRRGQRDAVPDVVSRTDDVHAYYWTIDEFCRDELLPFVFADADDDRQQYTIVVGNVTQVLKREAQAVGDDGCSKIDGTLVRTYDDLVDLVTERLNDDATSAHWAGPAMGQGTINAFVKRLHSSKKAIGHLVRGDLPKGSRRDHSIRTSDAKVTVVDLHNLPDRAKRFVVGVTVKRTFEEKEASGSARPLLFLVLDELNKYAPRDGSSPIKEILLDVAERGRSLGVILIGAQQTASEVERRVIANSAVRVAGRLDPAEAARPEYGFLPAVHQKRATIAKPGTMFVSQPEIPVPLVVDFPFPAWATRPSERGASPTKPDAPADPFEDF